MAASISTRSMRITRQSPCKVNLLLNTLGRRADGFTELETLFFPVPLHDELVVERDGQPGIRLTCSHPVLPVDGTNLVHRAASAFLEAAGIREGVALHLEKRLPLAAGIGAGSANAAHTLLALNELFGGVVDATRLDSLAARLGSDVNFFLQTGPALAFGRGERIEPLAPFEVLRGCALFLFHPGFGIPTPWAFKELAANHPDALNGRPGRAEALAGLFRRGELEAGGKALYNALELPALRKFPVLALYQEFLRERGAVGTLMSGSGSTTFGLFRSTSAAEAVIDDFRREFGAEGWLKVVTLS